MTRRIPAGMRVRPMQRHLSIVVHGVQRALVYRGTFLIEWFGQLMWAGMIYLVWRQTYADHGELAGMRWREMQSYVVTAAAIGMLQARTESDWRMFAAIRNGEIAVELTRPISYLLGQFLIDFGAVIVQGSRGVFVLALAWATGVAEYPSSLLAVVLFPVALGLAIVVNFLISYVIGLACFWTLNEGGVLWVRTALATVLSGVFAPLALLPSWVGAIAAWSPFPSVVYVPTMVLSGDVGAVVPLIGIQLAWVVILGGGATLCWRWAARVLVSHGG